MEPGRPGHRSPPGPAQPSEQAAGPHAHGNRSKAAGQGGEAVRRGRAAGFQITPREAEPQERADGENVLTTKKDLERRIPDGHHRYRRRHGNENDNAPTMGTTVTDNTFLRCKLIDTPNRLLILTF